MLVYEIPAGSVATALNAFAVRNGLHLLYEAHVTRALRTPGLSGAFSLREGLDRLLVGTGLTYRFGGPDEKAVSIILAQNDTGARSDAGAPSRCRRSMWGRGNPTKRRPMAPTAARSPKAREPTRRRW